MLIHAVQVLAERRLEMICVLHTQEFNQQHAHKGMNVPLTAARIQSCSATLAALPGLSLMSEMAAALPHRHRDAYCSSSR